MLYCHSLVEETTIAISPRVTRLFVLKVYNRWVFSPIKRLPGKTERPQQMTNIPSVKDSNSLHFWTWVGALCILYLAQWVPWLIYWPIPGQSWKCDTIYKGLLSRYQGMHRWKARIVLVTLWTCIKTVSVWQCAINTAIKWIEYYNSCLPTENFPTCWIIANPGGCWSFRDGCATDKPWYM